MGAASRGAGQLGRFEHGPPHALHRRGPDSPTTVDLDEASAIEQTLRHAGLMAVGTPTNAGILLLHNRPHQYIPGATVRIGFWKSRRHAHLRDEVFGFLIESALNRRAAL